MILPRLAIPVLLLGLACAAEPAPLPDGALAVWEAGSGTLAEEPAHPGLGVLAGQAVAAGPDGPVRLVLPGTRGGMVVLAAGARLVAGERGASSAAGSALELVLLVEGGAVELSGDLRPRYAGARLRGAGAEAVTPGAILALERGEGADTVVLVDGTAQVGPRAATANGWQSLAEQLVLAPRTGVVVDHLAGVGEPFPVPMRPQLAGTAADRLPLRGQAEVERRGDIALQDSYRTRFGGGPATWQLDAAGDQLGPVSGAWWAQTAAGARSAPAAVSGFVQLAALTDTNPGERVDGASDQALGLSADARWRFWQEGDYAARLQAVGGVVVHRQERDGDLRQGGLAAALLHERGPFLWSGSLSAALLDEPDRTTVMGRAGGDAGWEWTRRQVSMVGVGWSALERDPEEGDRYHVGILTLRPAHQMSWELADWRPTMEASCLITDSRSGEPSDDFVAIRPALSLLARWRSRLDLGAALAWERTGYRELGDGTGEDLVERTWAASLSADWWLTGAWTAGGFLNGTRLDSSAAGSDYSRVQAGVRSTYYW